MHVLKGRVTQPGVIVLDDPSGLEVGDVLELEVRATISEDPPHEGDELVDESPEFLAELLRRAESARLHPERLIPHDEVMARLRALK